MRAGIGSDVHRLISGRKLIIGGVTIPCDKGEEAHSDGDVLLHAIIDAVLGASAHGDIGAMFPDSSKDTEGMDSLRMLRIALGRTGARIISIDSTVHLEQPKLQGYIRAMRENIAAAAALPVEAVSVKAKTAEGLGPVGEGAAIAAEAIVLIES